MGFSSIDDWVNKVTNSAYFWRADWNKQTLGSAYTAGRWYDMDFCTGYPIAQTFLGEYVENGSFTGSAWGWTLGAGWSYASDTVLKSGDSLETLTQTTCIPVAARTYRVTYTITSWTSGTCTVSLGGTAGTARGSAATFSENIVTADATCLTFTPTNTARFTIDNISVTEILAATQMSDDLSVGEMYHGGDVSPLTKHIVNAGAFSATATFNPSVWMLVDKLLVYPFVDMNSALTQTMINNNALPRYADGKGVRAYVVPTNATGATAHNLSVTYVNTASVEKTLPVTVAGTASAIVGHILHSGVAANNYGPFLPMANADVGMLRVKDFKLSAATTTASYAAIVLCKPLLTLPMTTASVASERDLLNQLPSLPRVYDGAFLSWLFFAGGNVVANSNAYGYLDFCWG